MIERIFSRLPLLLLGCTLALPLFSTKSSLLASGVDPNATLPLPARDLPTFPKEGPRWGYTAPSDHGATSNSVLTLRPGPADGREAFVTALMLERFHYLHAQRPFDSALGSKFLDRYLETLDPQHIHFTQEDIAEFGHYRTNLDLLTVGPRRQVADTTPAYDIVDRFVQRLEQRVNYADELLTNEKFTFDADERITINRHELPYPKNLEEAKQFWRERLRFEYLQERLSKLNAKKKGAIAKTPGDHTDASNQADSKTNGQPKVASNASKQPSAPPLTEDEEIARTLTRSYHRTLRFFNEWNSDDVMQVYLSALARLFDPHSEYMPPAPLDNFAIGMNLSLFGIGAQLRADDGYCTIDKLLPGGPAAKSKKIKEKDRIVAVAQSNQPPVDVVEMSLNKAVQLIRGPKGTEVRLTIIPAGAALSESKVIALVRDEIKLEDSAAKAKIIDLPNSRGEIMRLGVIDLPAFYAPFDPTNTRDKSGADHTPSADVAHLLTKLKQENVKGIILDLRHNGGGSLEEAIKVTGLFIKKGPVVLVRDWQDQVQEEDDLDSSVAYDGPLIVLTSRLSASASEILAGALQDYGRALIVGDVSTHGKGTVQSVNALKPYMKVNDREITNEPGALKITIKKFYRPSGASTQLKGVNADIVLPSILNDLKEIGESSLDDPLAWDTIPTSKFDHLNLVEPYVAALRKHSNERVATNKEFSYVREDIKLYKKQQADKTISLNEKQRIQEKEENDARQKARDKERLARKDPVEKVYEITLKQAELPGLPPPVEKTNSFATASAQKDGASEHNKVALNHAAAGNSTDDLIEDPEEEKAPPVDATLVEAEHILMDYVTLLPKGDLVTAGH